MKYGKMVATSHCRKPFLFICDCDWESDLFPYRSQAQGEDQMIEFMVTVVIALMVLGWFFSKD